MPHEEKWIIFVLIVVLVIFGIQYKKGGVGGPKLSPKDRGGISNFLFPRGGEAVPNENPEIPSTNVTKNAVIPKLIIRSSQSKSQNPSEEYIALENTGSENVTISGLKLKNKRNEEAAILGDKIGTPISLGKGEAAIVITGISPRGFNFKINACSGYIYNSQNFIPPIYTSCPNLNSLPNIQSLKDSCRVFIDRISSCQIPNINSNSDIDNDCAQFVSQHASYQGCIDDFKNDPDFDQHEWRMYLGRSQEFWSNVHETIQLIDSSGKIVSETSY